MDKKENEFKPSTIDIGDRIIEDAQTTLITQTDHNKEVTLNLSSYIERCDDDLIKAITAYIHAQVIRLYEDECDEFDTIVNSTEKYTNIFKKIVLSPDKTKLTLFFCQEMIDLLN